MKFLKSSTLPILNDSMSAINFAFTCFHRFEGIYAREAAEHFCPWYSKAPRERAVTSESTSALGCASTKSFPPVSPTIRGYDLYFEILSPIVFQNPWNTGVEPVK